jgi:hypothetical protein
VKTHVIFLLAGAIVGAAVASVVVPPILSWYASPGGVPKGAQVQVIVQMPEMVRYATSKLILWQSIGAGVGAIVSLVLSLLLASRRRKAPTA